MSVTVCPKRSTAWMFLAHFGCFHIGYLVYLAAGDLGDIELHQFFWRSIPAFAINHAFSLNCNIEADPH